MRTIINSVGTSLLTNYRRQANDTATTDALVRFAREVGPASASAELNTLSRLELDSNDRLVFLHSDTEEGELCAEALSRFARQQFQTEAQPVRIEDLHFGVERFRKKGLRTFTNALVKSVIDARRTGYEPVINATGGFKAQIAFATAVGLILRVPVFYIHEQFDELVEMPTMPIGWDLGALVPIEPILDRLDDGIESQDLERLLSSYPPEATDLVRSLMDDQEAFPVLNDLGLALYSAFKLRSGEPADPIWLSNNAKRALDRVTGTSNESRIRMLIERLGNAVFRNSWEQKRNSDCLFFPKGSSDQRIAFFEDDQGRVVVVEIMLNHKDYEDRVDSRELQRQFFHADVEYRR